MRPPGWLRISEASRRVLIFGKFLRCQFQAECDLGLCLWTPLLYGLKKSLDLRRAPDDFVKPSLLVQLHSLLKPVFLLPCINYYTLSIHITRGVSSCHRGTIAMCRLTILAVNSVSSG